MNVEMQNGAFNPKQYYDEKMLEFTKSELFPNDKLIFDFNRLKALSFRFHSPVHLQISVDEFSNILDKTEGFTLHEIQFVMGAMENRTMNNLEMPAGVYIDYFRGVMAMGDIWNEIVGEKGKEINDEIKMMLDEKHPEPSNTIPLGLEAIDAE